MTVGFHCAQVDHNVTRGDVVTDIVAVVRNFLPEELNTIGAVDRCQGTYPFCLVVSHLPAASTRTIRARSVHTLLCHTVTILTS